MLHPNVRSGNLILLHGTGIFTYIEIIFFFSQRVGKYSSFTEHLEVLCSRQKSVAMQAAFHQTNILAALLLQVLIMQVGSVG